MRHNLTPSLPHKNSRTGILAKVHAGLYDKYSRVFRDFQDPLYGFSRTTLPVMNLNTMLFKQDGSLEMMGNGKEWQRRWSQHFSQGTCLLETTAAAGISSLTISFTLLGEGTHSGSFTLNAFPLQALDEDGQRQQGSSSYVNAHAFSTQVCTALWSLLSSCKILLKSA